VIDVGKSTITSELFAKTRPTARVCLSAWSRVTRKLCGNPAGISRRLVNGVGGGAKDRHVATLSLSLFSSVDFNFL